VAKFNAGKMLPSASRLMEITRFLSVSVDYLMGGDDVAGQVEDVMNNRPPRMTQRQEAQRTGARVARSGE
jgi:transcriptional regulator with XRE-family HTH domain